MLEKVEATGKAPDEIVREEGLARVSDEGAIRAVAVQVLAENPAEVASYREGKATLMGWFVGQIMRKMLGKADAQMASSILAELLQEDPRA